MLELIGIKTNDGIFLANMSDIKDYSNNSCLKNYKINGELPEITFHKSWVKIKSEPKTISKLVPGQKVNYRYVLKDETLANDKIPLCIKKEDATYIEDYETYWKEEYKHLASLYKLVWDTLPDTEENLEFTYKEILSVNKINKPVKLNWEYYISEWTHQGTEKVTTDSLEYRLLDKIAFPSIYYQTNCPVKLPSLVFYRMLRFYIRDNIDNKVAYIDSDYDFCFRVKKRIKLHEPKITQEEVLRADGKPYKNRKFVNKIHQYAGSYTVFEMTHEEQKYQDYPILPSITASNLEELKEKVDKIIATIIEEINSEVIICPHCEGAGIINKSKNKIDINQLISSF